MKKNLFCSIATIALLFSACSQEDLRNNSLSNEKISATIVDENTQTRTTLNDNLQVVWSADDAISVFAENGNSYTNNKGTITDGVGSTDATFSVVLEGEGTTKVAAAYPYASGTSYDGSKISITMQSEYTYSENGIGGAPMAAKISGQNANIAFKNAGALMGLTVNNIPAGYNKAILKSLGEEVLTGACEIAFDANGNPTLEATTSATGKVITINFDAAQTATNKTFFFPIPVDEYSSLELSISNGTEIKVLKTKALNAQRSIRYRATLTLDAVTGSTPVDASSAADATEKLQQSSSVNVTIPKSEITPTITLPETKNNDPISLSFENIPTGKTVIVNAITGQVSDDVNISASSDASSNNSFDIQLPNSTVTLSANGETATYNQVTAETAENTLIIGKGVTVKNLIVKKGHVRVHGTVETISRDEQNNSDQVTYIICEGELLNDSDPSDNIVYISAAEYDLRKAAKNGGTVVLKDNINIASAIQVVKDVTVNLNGKTLTSLGDGFEVISGTLTLTGNGTVNAGTTGGQWVAVWANGGNAIIENGTYSVVADRENTTNDCIYAKGGQITINGGTFSNVGTYVPGNGGVVINAHNTVANSKVVINGGTFKPAEGCVPYEEDDVKEGRIELNSVTNESELKIAVAAGKNVKLGADIQVSSAVLVTKTLTVDLNGKTLTSAGDGFEVTAGTLTLTGNGTVNAGTTGGQWVAVWANGGNAIIENGTYSVVADRENTTNDCIYAKGGQITINGGTFSNVGTYVPGNGGVVINAHNTVANSKVVINGGTFNPAEGCVPYEDDDVKEGRIELNK